MNDLFEILTSRRIVLREEIIDLLRNSKKTHVFNTTAELAEASVNGKNYFEVQYEVEGKGIVTEAIIHRVKNGISANYTEPYMRRRDPDTMFIADELPSDKPLFRDSFGYEFEKIEKQTFDWLRDQELGVFFYFAGNRGIGSYGLAIAPANAAFFCMGLSMLQKITAINDLPEGAVMRSVIYVAPPFRHTHFKGKQVVVHKRSKQYHEMFAFNLYPGPSAKKGLYGVLLTQGEEENWVTTHCSTVQAISPYDNITTYMHEGASGGGKSEMLQHIVREPEGQVLIGENLIDGEKRMIAIPMFCNIAPVTDDMALCHPSIQKNNGKLWVLDAENGWFIRVDAIKGYGDDPNLEKLTINTKVPLLFFNVDTHPECTALIWNHIEDEPGKTCPNPRVIVPRSAVPGAISEPVSIDVRSFGVRTPPFLPGNPSYAIIGLFHILPPALAWLWRLVAPRGYANPSIIGTGSLESEGVGSYWPFATGQQVKHANLLLEQIIQTPRVRYTLVPNQHIGAWKVGFKPQLMMREYLTRRGNAKLRSDQYQPARCSLLGFELNYITIEGSKIPSRFLKVYRQQEIGEAGYDEGAGILRDFFFKELEKFRTPELSETGHRIIDACYADATIQEYLDILPMDYQYSFLNPEENHR